MMNQFTLFFKEDNILTLIMNADVLLKYITEQLAGSLMLLMEHHHGRLRRRGVPVAETAVCLNTFGDHGNLQNRLKSQFSSGNIVKLVKLTLVLTFGKLTIWL